MRKFAHVCFRHAQLSRMSVSDMRGIRGGVFLFLAGNIVSQEQNVTPTYIHAREFRACLKQTCADFAHV